MKPGEFFFDWIMYAKAYTKPPRKSARCTENHNIVKFRALFGEASLQKKGLTAVHVLSISEYSSDQVFNFEYFRIFIFYVEDQKSSILVIIAPSN
jgi:hypothetical protein